MAHTNSQVKKPISWRKKDQKVMVPVREKPSLAPQSAERKEGGVGVMDSYDVASPEVSRRGGEFFSQLGDERGANPPYPASPGGREGLFGHADRGSGDDASGGNDPHSFWDKTFGAGRRGGERLQAPVRVVPRAVGLEREGAREPRHHADGGATTTPTDR